uniref:Serine/threonine-protein phosphatase 4 regulatory subunit 3-like central domain-containing protein n=1 Tax=Ananas comosus var. bracteatus TaxID=296719 RepID=A0A6V7NE73_ANACO|nr:unnamed protein product [Ananas comosus var. bracteatus]
MIGYLKDDILPGVLDQATKVTLETILNTNNALVISLLKDNDSFLQELVNKMRSDNTSAESKKDLVKGLITGLGCDIHNEFLEILQRLLDSKDMPTLQQDRIMHIFCEGYLDELMDVIELCCPPKNGSRRAESDAAYKPESLLNICELLRFCVIHHFNEISFYFYLSDVIKKILYLTRRRERFLVVAAVRFVRTIISSCADDELLLQHIACHNLLKPVIDVFTENGNRDNMLRSGVLELLEYICKSSHKSEPKDTRDTLDVRKNKDKSDEGGSARSESQKQDQTAETSKPDATEVDENLQAKRTKPPADDAEPSSSSAANRESEWEVSKRRKSF